MPKRVKVCRSKAKNQQMNMIRLLNLPLSRMQRRNHVPPRMLAELSHATTSQVTENASCAVSTDHTEASSSANGSGDAVSEREQYPVEYDPFDRPVEEVVMNLFEGDPPANPPPPKRRKGNDQ